MRINFFYKIINTDLVFGIKMLYFCIIKSFSHESGTNRIFRIDR